MTMLKICDGCERHVLGPEPRCPFCARPFAFTPAPRRSSRMVMMGLWVMLGASACGPGPASSDTGPMASTGDVPDPTTTTSAVPTSGATTMGSDGELTTGSDTASESGVDDSMDGGCSFYGGCPDGGPPMRECDMTSPQSCPEGEKCTPWASTGAGTWTGTHCVPVAPDPAQLDEPCTVEGNAFTGIDDCDLGLLCMGVDPRTNAGTCVAACTGSVFAPVCDQAEHACFVEGDDSLAVCVRSCDPVLQDCAGGEGCLPDQSGSFGCLPVALPVTAPGDACGAFHDCSAGQVCLDPTAFDGCDSPLGCCSTFCSLSDPDADASCAALGFGQQCLPWWPIDAPPGLEHVGVCTTI